MVDVGDKLVTRRTATAVGTVHVNAAAHALLQRAEATKKGDALTVAQLAGTMAAKNASALIPLCHPVILDRVDVRLQVQPEPCVRVVATVACEGKTGVEMEALAAVSGACLTLWDSAWRFIPFVVSNGLSNAQCSRR
jgi:cyclic pyranopterin phosphate synthase